MPTTQETITSTSKLTSTEVITNTTLVSRQEGTYSGLFNSGKFSFFAFSLAEVNLNVANLKGTGTTTKEVSPTAVSV